VYSWVTLEALGKSLLGFIYSCKNVLKDSTYMDESTLFILSAILKLVWLRIYWHSDGLSSGFYERGSKEVYLRNHLHTGVLQFPTFARNQPSYYFFSSSNDISLLDWLIWILSDLHGRLHFTIYNRSVNESFLLEVFHIQ